MSRVVASSRPSVSRLFSLLLANLVWLAPLFLFTATAASAQTTYTVTTANDDPTTASAGNCPGASCSLRDAILASNTGAGNTINFSITAPIQLGSYLPSITENTIVTGPATISGMNAYGVFAVGSGTPITGNVTISSVTVENGNRSADTGDPALGFGGGLFVYPGATVILSGDTFTNNISGTDGGGAILNFGTLNVGNCTFQGNAGGTASPGTGDGGAIENYPGATGLTVADSTFIGNTAELGAAIFSEASFTVTNSTFYENANGDAGTITIGTTGTATVTNSTFIGNTAVYGPNEGVDFLDDASATIPGLNVTNSVMDAATTLDACVTTQTTSDCPTNGTAGNVMEAGSACPPWDSTAGQRKPSCPFPAAAPRGAPASRRITPATPPARTSEASPPISAAAPPMSTPARSRPTF